MVKPHLMERRRQSKPCVAHASRGLCSASRRTLPTIGASAQILPPHQLSTLNYQLTMQTRTGKIARLPAVIREQVNRQLFNGLQGKHIIARLNTLPEVQRVLAELYAGVPIS